MTANTSQRFLGIDYGAKRVGLAVADGASRIATPLTVLGVVGKIPIVIAKEVATIAIKENVSKIIVGESKDFKGVDNLIMKKVRAFATALAEEVGARAAVIFEPEFMTTQQAEQLQGKHYLIDSSAAALILQSYLDRNLL